MTGGEAASAEDPVAQAGRVTSSAGLAEFAKRQSGARERSARLTTTHKNPNPPQQSGNCLPPSFMSRRDGIPLDKSPKEQEYIEVLWDVFDTHYTHGKYQFAF